MDIPHRTPEQAREDHDLLIELKTKMDALLASVSKIEIAFFKKQEDHETRIRALEQTRWTWGGAVAAIAVFGSYAINKILQ